LRRLQANTLIKSMQQKHCFLVVLFFTSLFASAQTGAFDYPEHANDIVKINVLSLPLKNVSVQYEKVLSRRVSVALGVRYMPMTALPFKNILINEFADTDQDTKDIINKSRLSNFAATPEVRFYLGKGYGRGFYIAPYYRYARFSTNTVTVNYSEPNGPKRSVNLDGSLSANTGGVMFGAQWFLGKHFVLDWWILGAHYGTGTGSFTGTPFTPFTPGEQADVRQAIEDVDIPLIDKRVSVTPNRVQVDASGPFGGLRAGLSFGVHF
jgi:hypothetical protein